jgi:L-alanine-DL-glutamate epimerase-like enolase superfamily enzyme
MAAEAGLPAVPHSANQSMVQVFTLHLLGSIPNAGPYMEYSIEPAGWTQELYAPWPDVKDGTVAIPDGPGWGVTVNPKWLESAERKASERK